LIGRACEITGEKNFPVSILNFLIHT
jgi:hypothetical protein